MCWVMPPASPAATLALRMASSSEVLPWSTWPMMVTTGARGSRSSGVVRRLGAGEDLVLAEGRRLDLVAELGGDERRGVEIDVLVDVDAHHARAPRAS